MNNQAILLHLRIAEKGKIYCVEGNYREALRHFREAIRLSFKGEHNEIFFQHYSQCVMETLELSEAYDEVIEYCDRIISFIKNKEEQNAYTLKYLASTTEKKAIQYLLKGERQEACDILKSVQSIIGKGKLPLTEELLNWVARGYRVSKKQIIELQHKHHYFIIRKNKINTAIAMEIPMALSPF